jgi:hypothetical protein
MAALTLLAKRGTRNLLFQCVGVALLLIAAANFFGPDAGALETVNIALSNKNFQMILYPIGTTN